LSQSLDLPERYKKSSLGESFLLYDSGPSTDASDSDSGSQDEEEEAEERDRSTCPNVTRRVYLVRASYYMIVVHLRMQVTAAVKMKNPRNVIE